MTLYDLTNVTTLQGNIEVKVFDAEGSEKEARFYRDQDDFTPHWCDAEDIEDLQVTYIYTTKSCDCTAWLVIELQEDE
jgi:hypothetical protein